MHYKYSLTLILEKKILGLSGVLNQFYLKGLREIFGQFLFSDLLKFCLIYILKLM